MKIKLIILLIIVILILSGASYYIYEKQQSSYNVIFISFDGLQAKHLSEYGYSLKTTPNLDSFLEKSAVFADAISPSSWTVPTFASIFTSMFPSEHKVVNKFTEYNKADNKIVGANLQQLTPSAVTVAQIFKENGYQTAAFTGDSGVSANFGFNAGFDTFYQTKQVFGGFDDTIPQALEWLKANSNKKFFLFLHGYDVHGQFQPKGGYDYRYVQKPYTGQYTGSTKEQALLREEGLRGELNLSEQDVSFWRAIYDEKINRADEKFGDFINQIEQMGLMKNTIFVVFSDHGTEFYEHKKFDHGHSLYGELINVIFSVRMPGGNGQTIKGTVSTLDIFPTIFGLLHKSISSIKQIDGYDLSSVVTKNQSVPERNIFFETDYRLYTHKRGVQTPDGWKLIMTMRDDGTKKELYNVKTDPNETVNLINEEPQVGYELEQIIYAHLKDMELKGGSSASGPWIYGCSPVYGDQCQ